MVNIDKFGFGVGAQWNNGTIRQVDLLGFVISGLLFIAVSIHFGDTLTVIGIVIWVISCMIWMIPFLKSKKP